MALVSCLNQNGDLIEINLVLILLNWSLVRGQMRCRSVQKKPCETRRGETMALVEKLLYGYDNMTGEADRGLRIDSMSNTQLP